MAFVCSLRDLHIVITCPAETSEGVSRLAKAGGIRRVTTVLGKGGIEAKERHSEYAQSVRWWW